MKRNELRCPRCASIHVTTLGEVLVENEEGVGYRCRNCEQLFVKEKGD